MSRALVVILSRSDRERVAHWADGVPYGTRVEFKAPKRTLPQNDLFWGLLTDFSKQVEHCGRKYTPDEWKLILMHAWGREVQFLPALDQSTFIPAAHSSDLSVQEMTDLIEFIFAEGANRGVQFHDGWKRKPNQEDAA